MSSAVETTSGGLVVVTQVLPSNQPHAQDVQQGGLRTQQFIRTYPMAVGTVQIMIGVLVLLSGIVMAMGAISLGAFSGFFVWGAGFYITSGALTVAAGKSLRPCLILISGSSGVLLVFHVLEFAVSITVSIYACRATCNCCDNQQHPYVYFTPAQAPPHTGPATMAVPPQQIPSSSKPAEDKDQVLPGLNEPPA
ncbi:membrane-spanning 4-domains subfamily A member 18-like isoform X2 [Cheilinus undulatus]|uniref:membrane-spanning 4-domains subfamily A member 18-like isoform X2 n=1 Tax=Cheilinus undulatus TaxID=241271 RepID=UPI001BD65820|nr:membrane-spanning 4-domains subfamily A member 18-like isoform X2 [Cheilinus undulatus]